MNDDEIRELNARVERALEDFDLESMTEEEAQQEVNAELGKLVASSETFRQASLDGFRTVASSVQTLFSAIPPMVYADIRAHMLLSAEAAKEGTAAGLAVELRESEEAQREHANALRPVLAHPNRRSELAALHAAEHKRCKELMAAIAAAGIEAQRREVKIGLRFVGESNNATLILLALADALITDEDCVRAPVLAQMRTNHRSLRELMVARQKRERRKLTRRPSRRKSHAEAETSGASAGSGRAGGISSGSSRRSRRSGGHPSSNVTATEAERSTTSGPDSLRMRSTTEVPLLSTSVLDFDGLVASGIVRGEKPATQAASDVLSTSQPGSRSPGGQLAGERHFSLSLGTVESRSSALRVSPRAAALRSGSRSSSRAGSRAGSRLEGRRSSSRMASRQGKRSGRRGLGTPGGASPGGGLPGGGDEAVGGAGEAEPVRTAEEAVARALSTADDPFDIAMVEKMYARAVESEFVSAVVGERNSVSAQFVGDFREVLKHVHESNDELKATLVKWQAHWEAKVAQLQGFRP